MKVKARFIGMSTDNVIVQVAPKGDRVRVSLGGSEFDAMLDMTPVQGRVLRQQINRIKIQGEARDPQDCAWSIDLRIRKDRSGMVFVTSEGDTPLFIGAKSLADAAAMLPDHIRENLKATDIEP